MLSAMTLLLSCALSFRIIFRCSRYVAGVTSGSPCLPPALPPPGPRTARAGLAPLGQSVLARHAAALRRHSHPPGPRTARAGGITVRPALVSAVDLARDV